MAGTGAAAPPPAMEHVRVSVDEARRVGHVTLAREAKSNALNLKMWGELATAIRWVGPRVHCVVLHARGANFCAGIDLQQVRARCVNHWVSAGAPVVCHLCELGNRCSDT
jgi:enoyl-CoA hydratase/carnithine racemase